MSSDLDVVDRFPNTIKPFLAMFSAAPKAKDSDEEIDDKKREKKGGKEKNADSDKKPVKKTAEATSGMKKLLCVSCCVSR